MNTKHLLSVVAMACSLAPVAPVNAQTCASQVLVPAKERPVHQTVETHEGSVWAVTTPAQLGYGERKIKVHDAYVRYTITPARFEEVTETIEVERERVEVTTLPPTYRKINKRIKTREATQRWNPQCPAVNGPDAAAVPAHCLIKVPAQYTWITQEVVALPARTVKTVIPAKTRTVTRKVLVEPSRVIEQTIPAEYITLPLQRIEQPPRTESRQDPERHTQLETLQQLTPEQLATRPALCENTLDKATLVKMQQRLHHYGYLASQGSGVLDSQTREALIRFQQANGLASGAITLETLEKLGIP